MFEEVVTILQNFGFPVLVCIVLMWYINETNKSYTQQIQELIKQHRETEHNMIEAINNNTRVMESVLENLGECRE